MIDCSHVRFGRLSRRWEEHKQDLLVSFVEDVASRKLAERERNRIVTGASESDLVKSGLHDTMIHACAETRATALRLVCTHIICD